MSLSLASSTVSLLMDDLAVSRGGRMLARQLNLRVKPSDALIVRGDNGAGKTSLLRVLAGFAAPAEGRSRILAGERGEEVEPADTVAYLGHADGIASGETARRHLTFFARWADVETMDPSTAADRFGAGLFLDRPARRLSAGQRRRVALARVAASGRPIWILDEPAASLDMKGRAQLAEAVGEHRAAGGIVIAAVHGDVDWPRARELRIAAAEAVA